MNTEWKCYRTDDLTDICVYSNLCFDGEHVLFLNTNLPVTQSIYNYPLLGLEKTVEFDEIYLEPYPFPPPMSEFVPFMSNLVNSSLLHPYQVNPQTILNLSSSVEFMDGDMYYTPFSYNSLYDSTWNLLVNSMNLWEAQILNNSLSVLCFFSW